MASISRAGSSSRVARSCSSNRVKPFTSSVRPQRTPKHQQLVARAAEEEEQAEVEVEEVAVLPADEPAVAVEDFVFNYSEAKRNNEYQASDVEAALTFYSEGTGDLPYEADFVGNPLGIEDAALFDDIDNNENYEVDEYASVGIPEAAPKSKGRGRRGNQQEEEGLTDEQMMVGDAAQAQ